MQMLLTISLLLVVCLLAFLISNLYLPHHEDFLADVQERCSKIQDEGDPHESKSCRFMLELAPNLNFIMEVVRFVSLCLGTLMIGLIIYCLCDRESRLKLSLKRELDLSQKVGKYEATIGQYRRRLRVNKQSERSFESELDQRKSEVEASQFQMEVMGQWNSSLSERNANLGKQIKRQHVRDRANWARSTLQKKKENELQKKLNLSSERIGETTREKQRLEEELARVQEERERTEREHLMARDRALAEHLAERERLEREREEEREKERRERLAERQQWQREKQRGEEEYRRLLAARGGAPPREEDGGWCVVS